MTETEISTRNRMVEERCVWFTILLVLHHDREDMEDLSASVSEKEGESG